MNVLRLRELAPIVLALLVASAGETAAQSAPTVTASVNGGVVTVQWNGVPGATAYDIIVTGSLSGTVSVPASVTSFTVTAPPGIYNIQIRGTAGSVQGPLSNTATVNVGGGGPTPGCPAPAAPAVTASVAGFGVTVSWTPVAGAIGYRVEFSRTPGGTELVQTVPAAQTAIAGNVPFAGTFFVRVTAGSACGATATSTEISFTAGTSPAPVPPGGGNRTPDPVPGQPGTFFHDGEYLLPVPAYGRDVVNALAAAFPGEAAAARPSECPGGNNRFLFRVLQELRKRDTRWGLNYKRGNAPTLSEDIITYNGTNRPDNGESHVWLTDIVGGACFGGVPVWRDVSLVGTWDQKGQSYCGTTYCARWNIDPYLAAGYPAFPQ
jgi:hypothetical protein